MIIEELKRNHKAPKEINFEELCKLLEVCHTMNVKEIILGEVKIIFRDATLPKEKGFSEASAMVEVKATTPAPEAIEEVDPAVLRQLEADIKQAHLDQMMITDPAQFEELITAGDIEHDDNQ